MTPNNPQRMCDAHMESQIRVLDVNMDPVPGSVENSSQVPDDLHIFGLDVRRYINLFNKISMFKIYNH